MIFLSLIPLLAFFIFFLILIRRDPGLDRRLAFLRAAVLWGAYMVLETELLSLVRGVTQPGLVIAWCLPILLGGAWLIWNVRRGAYKFRGKLGTAGFDYGFRRLSSPIFGRNRNQRKSLLNQRFTRELIFTL